MYAKTEEEKKSSLSAKYLYKVTEILPNILNIIWKLLSVRWKSLEKLFSHSKPHFCYKDGSEVTKTCSSVI